MVAPLSPRARADIAHSLILQRLPHGSAGDVAKAMGVSDKDMSEIKNKMLAPSLLLLATLGYKIVPVTAKCLDPVAFEFLTALQQRVSRRAPSLQWEDSELGNTGPGALNE